MSEHAIRPDVRADAVCVHCGQRADAHWITNYVDGPYRTEVVLVCPSAVFTERPEQEQWR